MEITKHKWQQCGTHNHFVYALNDKGFNDFCFIVQGGNNAEKERAVATLACAAPALLEALEAMMRMHGSESVDDAATKKWTLNQARAAIKQAKGEV